MQKNRLIHRVIHRLKSTVCNNSVVVKKVDLNQLQQKQQITTNQFVVTLNPIKSMVYGVFQIFQQQAVCCRGQGKTALTTKTTHTFRCVVCCSCCCGGFVGVCLPSEKSGFGVAAYIDIRPLYYVGVAHIFLKLVVYFFIFSCIIKLNVKNRS